MKVGIVGRNMAELLLLLERFGSAFLLVEHDPEFVISYGGDGTLLEAEYLYPGIPKINLKDSAIGKLASSGLPNEIILEKIRDGAYEIEAVMKLEAEASGMTLRALNDIVIHNTDPRHAIRYRVTVRGMSIGGVVIGDGAVVSTPFGSTGYYRSITDSIFEVGIGLAFNNSTETADHIVLREDSEIVVEIVRGPAVCYADNQKEHITLASGDRMAVRAARTPARIVRTSPAYVWQAGSRTSSI
jgi:NAD+ kinase